MSREIKFRGWYTGPHVNRMLEPNFNGPVNEIFNDPDNEGKVIYMQYTGLKDKHGTEIFEGDIVKFHYKRGIYKIGPVVWNDMFGSWDIDCTDFVAYKSLGKFNSVSEVIGNIYENPELLEETA